MNRYDEQEKAEDLFEKRSGESRGKKRADISPCDKTCADSQRNGDVHVAVSVIDICREYADGRYHQSERGTLSLVLSEPEEKDECGDDDSSPADSNQPA